MKIRDGFVSNSSSSNFILALDKRPESVEDLQKTMFGDKEQIEGYNTKDIAEAVLVQLQKEMTLDDIIEELTSGWLNGVTEHYDWDNMPEPGSPEYYDWHEQKEEERKIRALEYFNKWKTTDNKKFYCVEFADENGHFDSFCEHGDIFRNIDHITISHH